MDVQISEWAMADSTPEIMIERLKLNVIFRQIQAVESSQIFLGIENHSSTRIITQEFEVFLVKVILQGIPYWNIRSNLGLTDRNMPVRFGFMVFLRILRFGNLWNNNQFLWNAYCALISVRSWNFKDGGSLKASFLAKNQHATKEKSLKTSYE